MVDDEPPVGDLLETNTEVMIRVDDRMIQGITTRKINSRIYVKITNAIGATREIATDAERWVMGGSDRLGAQWFYLLTQVSQDYETTAAWLRIGDKRLEAHKREAAKEIAEEMRKSNPEFGTW
jgi:hypothetical protein